MIDQSLSRSLNGNGNTSIRHLLIQGKSYTIDILFPLFDQMVQLTKLPTVFTTIFAIFFGFQMLIFSFWPIGDFWGDASTPLSYITLIFWFVKSPPTTVSLLVVFIIHVVLFCFTFFWIFGFVIYYVNNLRFFTWGLYLTRFILECLYPILVCSCQSLVGSSIYLLIHNEGAIYWAFVIISIIMFVGYILIYSIGNATIGRSSCLAISLTSSFVQFIPSTFLVLNSVSSIFSYIFTVFPLYSTLVLIFIHFVLVLMIAALTYLHIPYQHKYGNMYIAAIAATQSIIDFVVFIFFIIDKTMSYFVLLVFLALFVILCVASYFIFENRYKKITKDLYISPDDPADDETLFNLFESIGLHQNESLAITYLHVGVTQMSPLLLNWSLIRFISQRYTSNFALCSVIQVLSYFPSEFRQMNALFSTVTTRTDLSFINRFLIYQVYRIKTLRQSSSSSDANERLIKLRSLTEQCMSNVVAFWRSHDPGISFFESLAKEEHRVKSLWLEAIRDYPNSAKLYEEYTTFLVECIADFHAAVTMKQKAEMIEHGNCNFAVDAAFRSLVWSIPQYVKKGILDTKGTMLERQIPQNGNNNSGQHSAYSSQSYDSELSSMGTEILETGSNIQFEQRLARQMLPKSNLRLACDEALKKRSHPAIAALPALALLSLAGGVAVYVALFVYVRTNFVDRKNSINYIGYMNHARFAFTMADFLILMRYIGGTNRFNVTVGASDPDDPLEIGMISSYNNLSREALAYSHESRTYFDMLLLEISSLSLRYINIYPLATQLASRVVPLYVCHNGTLMGSHVENMKNGYSLSYFLISALSAYENPETFFNDDNFCMLTYEQYQLMQSCDNLFSGFLNYAVNSGQTLTKTMTVLMILCPILLFLISFLPYFIASLAFIHHVDKIASIFSSLDRKIKEEAMQPIRQDMQPTIYSISDPALKVTQNVWFNVVNFIASLLTALLCLGMLHIAYQSNQKIDKLNTWNYNAARRLGSSVDFVTQCFQVIILNTSDTSSFIQRERAITLSHITLKTLETSNNELLRGNDQAPSISGFDKQLDDLNFQESCVLDSPAVNFHDSYRCGSADKLLATIRDLAAPILTTPEIYNGTIERYEPLNLLHILNNHLWKRYIATSDRISDLSSSVYNTLVDLMILFLCLGLVVSMIIFADGFYLQSLLKMTYSAALSELKRIPPHLIISEKNLKNILLNRNEESSLMTSVSRNVLHNSSDAILCVSSSGVIEMVNPAVATTLGFTPEQVLGQPIKSFFSESDSTKVLVQMKALTEQQSHAVYEDHVHCITDSRSLIPVYLTLLGMRRGEDSGIESYVFILRNESNLLQQQAIAEEAKAKSENLLCHILPQNIIMKLNSGEKDICFTVPNATIIFIDVVKFSEFTRNLQPTEIMGTLSHLFLSFDKLLPSFPLITKIKLIGDIYMAAAGLFSEGANPKDHANQTIQFGLNALAAIDDVNVKLNSNLQIRIGVNSGGPVIAGVLGTDKPVFDIIGDPINVAARLQTTDIPGQIQIPQSTYDLLEPGQYNVTQRGEVFLKGKGQVMTYLVMSDE